MQTSTESTDQAKARRPSAPAGIPLPALAVLLLTTALSLLISHYKMMWVDEFFELQTDGLSSIRQLIHIERTSPISLDPLVYHLLSHGAIRVFGHNAFAMRLPSLLGFLLMQVCLFVFVRRVASERAAVFAIAFPAVTLAMSFSSDGRPYGLLLGFFALAMVSWQGATRRESGRIPDLAILAVAIALAINTHYFGVLLLVPICGAELFRTLQRRRLDFPVAAAICAGMAGIVFVLPFMKAAGEFRKNYYNANAIGAAFIPLAYRHFLLPVTKTVSISFVLILVIAVAVLLWAVFRNVRGETVHLANAESAFILLLAALPLFGYLLAHFVTHSIETRFVVGAVVGIAALLAVALSPVLRVNVVCVLAFALLFIGIAGRTVLMIHQYRTARQAFMSSLTLTPGVKAAILASPTGLLYFQDVPAFDAATYYEPDAEVRSRMALVYSANQEQQKNRSSTLSLTALHMSYFTGFHILPYESLIYEPGSHVFVILHGKQDWTDQAFSTAHAEIVPLGPAFGGTAVSVRFRSPAGR